MTSSSFPGLSNPNLSSNSSSVMWKLSGDVVIGMFVAPGIRPVEANSPGSRTSIILIFESEVARDLICHPVSVLPKSVPRSRMGFLFPRLEVGDRVLYIPLRNHRSCSPSRHPRTTVCHDQSIALKSQRRWVVRPVGSRMPTILREML